MSGLDPERGSFVGLFVGCLDPEGKSFAWLFWRVWILRDDLLGI